MSKDEDFSRYQSTYIDENAAIHFIIETTMRQFKQIEVNN